MTPFTDVRDVFHMRLRVPPPLMNFVLTSFSRQLTSLFQVDFLMSYFNSSFTAETIKNSLEFIQMVGQIGYAFPISYELLVLGGRNF